MFFSDNTKLNNNPCVLRVLWLFTTTWPLHIELNKTCVEMTCIKRPLHNIKTSRYTNLNPTSTCIIFLVAKGFYPLWSTAA